MFAESLARWFGKDTVLPKKEEHTPTWFDPSAIRAVDWTARFLLFGIIVVLFAADASRPAGVLIAGAIAAAAAVIGFLFGIPRSVAVAGATAPGEKTGNAATAPSSAGLEQVSDWLTKVIVGASLTSLSAIKGYVVTLAKYLAACVSLPGGDGQTASVAFVFGLGVVGYFSAFGFLGGYLSTRLLLARLLRMADKSVEQIAHETGAEAGKKEALAAVGSDLTALVRNVTQPQLAIAANDADRELAKRAEGWKPTAEPKELDDPQKGRFGGQPEANGRRLEAKVSGSRGVNSELFRIDLRVASTDPTKPALSGPVKFFLHDTFDPDTYVVMADGGTASLSDVVAWGAFTVGVMCDDGKTMLELDLSELSDAPKKFRDR